jgi:hypothetical protein
MTVEESHFQVAKMPKSARHEASSPGVKDFKTAGIAFSGRQNDEKLIAVVIYTSAKVFITLE